MTEHFKVASTILILGMNMWDLRRKDGEWLHRWWDEALSPSYDLQTLIISIIMLIAVMIVSIIIIWKLCK